MSGGSATLASSFLTKIPTTIMSMITTSPTIASSATTRRTSIQSTPSNFPIAIASTAGVTTSTHSELKPLTKILIGTLVSLFIVGVILYLVLRRRSRWYAKLCSRIPRPSLKARGKRRASGEMIEKWRKKEERKAMPPVRINVSENPIAPTSGDNSDVEDLIEELRYRESPISVRYERIGESSRSGSSSSNNNGMLRTITEEPTAVEEGEAKVKASVKARGGIYASRYGNWRGIFRKDNKDNNGPAPEVIES